MTGFVVGTALLGLAVLMIGYFAAAAFDDHRNDEAIVLVVLIVALVASWFGYVWLIGEVAS